MSPQPDRVRNAIVTLESLQPPLEEGLQGLGAAPPPAESLDTRMATERYAQIMERLRQETKTVGPNLMITVPDREASLVQSELARQASESRQLEAGGLEAKFGTGFFGGDWFGWARSLFDHVDRKVAHPIMRPTTAKAEPIPDTAKIAMTADWGTALYGALKIAEQMRKVGAYDLLMHLGDVYYSGTREEVQERFLDIWPKDAGKRTIAVNANHEMYSGGFGYFELMLPAIGQKSSYLAFENTHWLLVVLDTAYVDHDMDNQQVAWLNLVLKQSREANGGVDKKLVVFSHQQLFSRLDNQGPKLENALRHLLTTGKITVWYWGHEHQCVIYDKHPRFGLLGRCLGNGGIPEVRKRDVKEAPTEQSVAGVMWKRLSATDQSPSCLALDGPNPDIPGEAEKFVPHGYMTLEFDGAALIERVHLANGTEILRNRVE
jgi:predicted phosphodiesterase